MSGKLYLCATPIGNLEDITLRVLRTLKEVDLIAAEDTRNSIKLLNHFDIKTPMTSYHEYNKIDKNYLPQLFYALSNATSQSDINLCLLLPVAQMAQKDKLISRLQNNSFSFKINGEHRLININKVAVLAEGVVGFYGLQDRDKDTLVIDIGGRTVNYAVFINGRPDKNFTEKIGVFDLYTIIKDYENAKGKNYIEEEIERLIKNGRIKVEPKVYLSFLKDILNRTKSRINITDYEVVFVGGGASLLKVYIEANTPGVVCEDSIFANLNGAQKLCEVMWRGN